MLEDREFSIVYGWCQGLAGANDTGFDIVLMKHQTSGWTYAATGFEPGTGVILKFTDALGTESDLVSGKHFRWDQAFLLDADGTNGEGFLLQVTTTGANSVDFMVCEGSFIVPRWQPFNP